MRTRIEKTEFVDSLAPAGDLPVVCTLEPGELNRRATQLLPDVAKLAKGRTPIEGGYRFEFIPSTEVLTALVAAVDAERQCCRFLRFQLTVEPDDAMLRLDITGPKGTPAFLDGLLEPA